MIGRRVTSIAALSKPGDYVPVFTENGAIKALWFILPEGTYGRIAAEGHEKGTESGWKITLDENGAVTVDPRSTTRITGMVSCVKASGRDRYQ
jgi:hypothetical protein